MMERILKRREKDDQLESTQKDTSENAHNCPKKDMPEFCCPLNRCGEAVGKEVTEITWVFESRKMAGPFTVQIIQGRSEQLVNARPLNKAMDVGRRF